MFSLLQLVVLVYKWWGTVRHASWTFLLISQLEGFGLYVSTQSTCRRHSVKTKCNNFYHRKSVELHLSLPVVHGDLDDGV